jgi:hypothetical protein
MPLVCLHAIRRYTEQVDDGARRVGLARHLTHSGWLHDATIMLPPVNCADLGERPKGRSTGSSSVK